MHLGRSRRRPRESLSRAVVIYAVPFVTAPLLGCSPCTWSWRRADRLDRHAKSRGPRSELVPRTGETGYGFEFTIPLTLERYFGGGQPAARRGAPSAHFRRTAAAAAIQDFQSSSRHASRSPRGRPSCGPTADRSRTRLSADDGSFESGPIEPGARRAITFARPGTYPFHCTLPSLHEGRDRGPLSMKTRSPTVATLAAALGLAGVLTGCFSEHAEPTATSEGTCNVTLDDGVPGSTVIVIHRFAFGPGRPGGSGRRPGHLDQLRRGLPHQHRGRGPMGLAPARARRRVHPNVSHAGGIRLPL